MKIGFVIILFSSFLASFAQQKIAFEYDFAGNQTLRVLCLSGDCVSELHENEETGVADKDIVKEEKPQKFSSENQISYYPNPAKDEVYLTWEVFDNNNITAIEVFSIGGQRLNSYVVENNSQQISFNNYPTGIYMLNLIYANGDKKAIKIIKK